MINLVIAVGVAGALPSAESEPFGVATASSHEELHAERELLTRAEKKTRQLRRKLPKLTTKRKKAFNVFSRFDAKVKEVEDALGLSHSVLRDCAAGTPSDTMPSPPPPPSPPPFAPTECTLENLQKIGTELTADQLPIDCRGKEIDLKYYDSPFVYLRDMDGDKVDFTRASLLGDPSSTYEGSPYGWVMIGSAVGGRFRGSTIATEADSSGIYFIDYDGGGSESVPADLTGANFEEASFTTEGGQSPIYFPSANLNGANFEKASLITSSSYSAIGFMAGYVYNDAFQDEFGNPSRERGQGTDLTDASFEKAFLMTKGGNVKSGSNTDISFSDATLTRANFKEASIKTLGTSHDGRNSAHIKFDDSDLTDAKFDGAYFHTEYGSVYNSDGSKLSASKTPYDDTP